MTTSYTNLPASQKSNNDLNNKTFINYFTAPLEVSAATLDIMKSFFTSKGFEEVSAFSLASTFIAQAKKDNLNPLVLLDTLKGFNDVELNSLVAEIINYNRYKTSFLGFSQTQNTNDVVVRNIVP